MADGTPDWERLLESYGNTGHSSTADGQDLLTKLIGDDTIESAVDHYVQCTDVSIEPLRHAMKLLQPALVTKRCLGLLWSDAPNSQRDQAADLLQVTCRASDLDKVEELLNDDDPVRQSAAQRILLQLCYVLDLDTIPLTRIIRRCREIGAYGTGFQLTIGAIEELTDPAVAGEDRSGRLTMDEIQDMFVEALTSKDQWIIQDALSNCWGLVEPLRQFIEPHAVDDDSYNASIARELLDELK